MQVRPEGPDDRDAVREVQRGAFGDHGGEVVELVDALRDTITAELGLSIVAEDDGDIIGHVMFTTSLLDAPGRLVDVQVLSPLGVAAEHQGRGVGSALVRHGLAAAAEQGAPLVFLEGDPRYYSRFGFTPGGELGFRKPSLRIPDEAFQVVKLPAFEPWMGGTLVYAEVFWRYDCVGLRDPDPLPSPSDIPRP
ncbi:MAG: GNAT family N-acetyltransferase [Acidimicrobiales bacterium]